jgi:hypothetical protein
MNALTLRCDPIRLAFSRGPWASALLRAPEDPLREAKEVLRQPGPLSSR